MSAALSSLDEFAKTAPELEALLKTLTRELADPRIHGFGVSEDAVQKLYDASRTLCGCRRLTATCGRRWSVRRPVCPRLRSTRRMTRSPSLRRRSTGHAEPAKRAGAHASDERPVRDLAQPTGGVTLPRMPVWRPGNPTVITSVERAAASAALGCPPWELGPCAECGQLMRRYGRNAAMFCAVCRAILYNR